MDLPSGVYRAACAEPIGFPQRASSTNWLALSAVIFSGAGGSAVPARKGNFGAGVGAGVDVSVGGITEGEDDEGKCVAAGVAEIHPLNKTVSATNVRKTV